MSPHDRRREGTDPPAGGGGGSARPSAGPGRVDELLAAGLECYRSSDWSGARDAWERARQADPGDPRAAEYLTHIDRVVGAGEPLSSRGDEARPSDAGDDALDDALTVERPGVRKPELAPNAADEDELELMPPARGIDVHVDIGDDDATRERFPSGEPWAGAMPPREGDMADLAPLEMEVVEAAEGGSLAEVLSGVAESLRGDDAGEEASDDIRDRLLAELERDARAGEAPGDAASRRIDALAVVVGRELAAGRATAAVVAANLAMDEQPDSAASQKRLHEHAATLLRAYEKFLGHPASVPLVALPLHELPAQKLDSREAFLLSRVDGMLSFDEILDVSGMPRLEACSYLARLLLQGIIDVQ